MTRALDGLPLFMPPQKNGSRPKLAGKKFEEKWLRGEKWLSAWLQRLLLECCRLCVHSWYLFVFSSSEFRIRFDMDQIWIWIRSFRKKRSVYELCLQRIRFYFLSPVTTFCLFFFLHLSISIAVLLSLYHSYLIFYTLKITFINIDFLCATLIFSIRITLTSS